MLKLIDNVIGIVLHAPLIVLCWAFGEVEHEYAA
jgi:hypothetical protein